MNLDFPLSRFRWYRRLRGGRWYRTRLDVGIAGPFVGWHRTGPFRGSQCEILLGVEDYDREARERNARDFVNGIQYDPKHREEAKAKNGRLMSVHLSLPGGRHGMLMQGVVSEDEAKVIEAFVIEFLKGKAAKATAAE